MYRILLGIIFIIGAGVMTGAAQHEYCFRKDSPKGPQTVSFVIERGEVDGTFVIGRNDDHTFEFTGTKSGNLLNINFKGTIPYNVPPGSHKIVWTLGPKRTLKVPMYGKDKNTGKYAISTATYTWTCADL